MSTKFKSVIDSITPKQNLEEMVHYPSQKMVYQKDSKFVDISVENIKRMDVIHQDDNYIYTHKDSSGFVFVIQDIKDALASPNAIKEVKPVMHVFLRPSVKGLKQANNLRIREYFAGEEIAKTWYYAYIDQISPVVSDKDHLEGGYRLWKHFIKKATDSPNYNIQLVNTDTNEVVNDNVTTATPENELWSQHTKENKDQSKANLVLIMSKI